MTMLKDSDRFLLGKAVATLRIKEQGREAREIRLSERLVGIGRDPSLAVSLNDETVSREHARIVRHGGRYEIEDLGSSNGVFLNGERLARGDRAVLRHGDRMRIGRSALRFAIREITDSSQTIAPSRELSVIEEDELPERLLGYERREARLLVVCEGQLTERHFLGSGVIRIGRSLAADIVLRNPTASKIHAEIVCTSEGLHLVDQASRQGSFVDGTRVRVAKLEHRTYLRFGKVKALLIVHDAETAPAPPSFEIRDALLARYPERASGIQQVFRKCRSEALDFAEELVYESVIDPEEWWQCTREIKKSSSRPGGFGSSLSRWIGRRPR